MMAQVRAAEEWRKSLCERHGFPLDSCMLILWDVYSKHRDGVLLAWMKEEFPCLIVLFIPANLTELLQPLDCFLNAKFKLLIAALLNAQNAERIASQRLTILV